MTVETLQHWVDAISGTQVLIIGDVMIDAYLWGHVDRISPESPVPVVNVYNEEIRLGGAGNVALNVKSLGAVPLLCSVIGADNAGRELRQIMQQEGMEDTWLVESTHRQTTRKTRIIGRSQQMLRVDREDTHTLQNNEETRLLAHINHLLDTQQVAAIIFQDYNKGVLTPNIIREVIALANDRQIPTAVDPKEANFLAYSGTTLFKPNLKELRTGMQMTSDLRETEHLEAAVQTLRQQMEHEWTLVTRSEQGVWIGNAGESYQWPSKLRSVSDVSGAGDTVLAVAALLLAHHTPAKWLAGIANIAGGLVCEEVGVVPVDPDKLRQALPSLIAS